MTKRFTLTVPKEEGIFLQRSYRFLTVSHYLRNIFKEKL